MNSNTALKRLIEGNNRFVEDKLEGKLKDSERRKSLSQK